VKRPLTLVEAVKTDPFCSTLILAGVLRVSVGLEEGAGENRKREARLLMHAKQTRCALPSFWHATFYTSDDVWEKGGLRGSMERGRERLVRCS